MSTFNPWEYNVDQGLPQLPLGKAQYLITKTETKAAASGKGIVATISLQNANGETFAERLNVQHENEITERIGREQLARYAICSGANSLALRDGGLKPLEGCYVILDVTAHSTKEGQVVIAVQNMQGKTAGQIKAERGSQQAPQGFGAPQAGSGFGAAQQAPQQGFGAPQGFGPPAQAAQQSPGFGAFAPPATAPQAGAFPGAAPQGFGAPAQPQQQAPQGFGGQPAPAAESPFGGISWGKQ